MRSRRNSGSTSTGICSSTRRHFDDAFCSSTRRLAFCSSPRRLAFCSSTQRRDDDATTTQRRRDGSTRGAGGGHLQPTDQLSHGLGASELGRLPGLDSPGARASKGGYVPPEGYWHDIGSGRPPEQARAPGRPFVRRAARVESSTGGNFPWRSAGSKTTGEERGEEGQAHSSAIQLVFILVYEVCEGAPPIVEVEWWRRTSQEELTVESEAVTGREP